MAAASSSASVPSCGVLPPTDSLGGIGRPGRLPSSLRLRALGFPPSTRSRLGVRLRLPAGTPVLTVRRIAFDTKGLPVELTDTVKAAPSYVLEYRFPAN